MIREVMEGVSAAGVVCNLREFDGCFSDTRKDSSPSLMHNNVCSEGRLSARYFLKMLT